MLQLSTSFKVESYFHTTTVVSAQDMDMCVLPQVKCSDRLLQLADKC